MHDTADRQGKSKVHVSHSHDSAILHVSGEAMYIDDIAEPEGTLQVYIGQSPHAHARILSMDLSGVREMPGVVAVVAAEDVPGLNDISCIGAGDEPVFADGLVECHGQPVFSVAAESIDVARAAAAKARIEYQPLDAILSIQAAMAAESYVVPPRTLRRGDAEAAVAEAPYRLQGQVEMGGQDHFYLEGQISFAMPGEDGDMFIFCSTQHPSEVQHCCARVLGLAAHQVTIEVRRMGGGFGGKETQAAHYAVIAAMVARITGRPAKLRLDREDDMRMTGKRHDFIIDYDVGFDGNGRIEGIVFKQMLMCGKSSDLSGAVGDRGIFHADNAYYLGHVTIHSYRCKTHTVSNTAFRGFGIPQGMMGIERTILEISHYLGKDPLDVRRANYYGPGRDTTHYGQKIEGYILPEIVDKLERDSAYRQRRKEIARFNTCHPVFRKGISLTPVMMGVCFSRTHMNQAGALIHIYTDGSILLNHGGTEMGQGLYIKVAQIVANEFDVDLRNVKVSATVTDKVPNTSATASSAGSDLNGMAARDAARKLKQRLLSFASEKYDVEPEDIAFEANHVWVGDKIISFVDLVKEAYLARVSLSATGFYKTPKIHYDDKTMQGRPFLYFAFGAAVSEVIIDTLTGEYRVERVDILHDVGKSLNPAIDLGQIEGGFIQGMGWLTTEELWWDDEGRLRTHSPSTYKIPTSGDRPRVMNIDLMDDVACLEDTPYWSKAVGEPPLMLSISVYQALIEAVTAANAKGKRVDLAAPATPERVLLACSTGRDVVRRK